MNIYIVHYKKLEDRKRYIKSKLPNSIFVEEFDRCDYQSHIKYDNEHFKTRLDHIKTPEYKPEFKTLKDSEICNSLSHLKAIELLLKSGDDYALILEDDILIEDDFLEVLNKIEIPNDFDYIFLGDCYSINYLDKIHMVKSVDYNEDLIKKCPGTSRTVDSYLISREGASKTLEEINNIITMPFDHELNFIFKKSELNVYWHKKGITKQGTKTGFYKSSIR
jgi:glycosyl transferase family 25